jgi:hypothetical protein
MSDQAHDPEILALANALAALKPTAGQLARDRVMFRAGQLAGSRGRWVWPASTVLASCVAAVLGVLLAFRPLPEPVERVVYQHVPVPPVPEVVARQPVTLRPVQATVSAEEEDFHRALTSQIALREWIVKWGVEALPPPAPIPPTQGQPLGSPPLLPSRSLTLPTFLNFLRDPQNESGGPL